VSNRQLRRNFEVQLQWDRRADATRSGVRRGVRKVESTDGGLPVFSTPFGISFIMRTQSTFSWPSSLVLATGDHSASLGRSIPIGHSSLKSRASIYWVFSSVKIFHRTFLSETGSCSSTDVFRAMSHNDLNIKYLLCILFLLLKRRCYSTIHVILQLWSYVKAIKCLPRILHFFILTKWNN